MRGETRGPSWSTSFRLLDVNHPVGSESGFRAVEKDISIAYLGRLNRIDGDNLSIEDRGLHAFSGGPESNAVATTQEV